MFSLSEARAARAALHLLLTPSAPIDSALSTLYVFMSDTDGNGIDSAIRLVPIKNMSLQIISSFMLYIVFIYMKNSRMQSSTYVYAGQ